MALACSVGNPPVELSDRIERSALARSAGNEFARAGAWSSAKDAYGQAFACLVMGSGELAALSGKSDRSNSSTGDDVDDLPVVYATALASARLPIFSNRAQANLKLAEIDKGIDGGSDPSREKTVLALLESSLYDSSQAMVIVENLYRHVASDERVTAPGCESVPEAAADLPTLSLSDIVGYHTKALHRRARARLEQAAVYMARETAAPKRRYWDPDRVAALLELASDDLQQLRETSERAKQTLGTPANDDRGAGALQKTLTAHRSQLRKLRSEIDAKSSATERAAAQKAVKGLGAGGKGSSRARSGAGSDGSSSSSDDTGSLSANEGGQGADELFEPLPALE